MKRFLPDPQTLVWTDGPLPPVDAVPKDHLIIVWCDYYVGLAGPHGDNLNPVRWCDRSGFPLAGLLMRRVTAGGAPVGNVLRHDDRWESIPFIWAVVKQGTHGLQHDQQTWNEVYGVSGTEHPQVP